MNKLMLLVIMLLLLQCNIRKGHYYPPANPIDFIKDRFYYPRDTINFYEVKLSSNLESKLDSIIKHVPIVSENHYWTVTIINKSLKAYSMILEQNNCEEFFMEIEFAKSMYKAMDINGTFVLVMDPYNVFEVAVSKPFIKVKNPRELKAIYQRVGGFYWLFKLDKKGEFLSVESSND